MGCAPGGLTMTACVGNKRYEIKPPFASSSGFPPALGAEASAIPAAGTSVAVTGDGRDAGGHPAPPVVLAGAAWLPAPCPFPAGWHWRRGGTGMGFGGQPAGLARGWAPGSRILRKGICCRRQQRGATPEPRCSWAWRP